MDDDVYVVKMTQIQDAPDHFGVGTVLYLCYAEEIRKWEWTPELGYEFEFPSLKAARARFNAKEIREARQARTPDGRPIWKLQVLSRREQRVVWPQNVLDRLAAI